MDSFEFNKQHSFNEKGICTKCGMSKVFADAFGKNCNIVTDFNENSYATTNLTDQDQEKPNIDFYTILSSINNDLKNIITTYIPRVGITIFSNFFALIFL